MAKRSPEDFSAELEAHLRLECDRLMAEGMSADEARAAALRAFGSPTRSREQFHERSRWMWLEQFAQDVKYAWRGLRGSPSFLGTTVVTLAVGLSLLTVAFTVFNAYVLRPFAVADPGRLYRIAWRAPDAVGGEFSRAGYEELRRRTDLFDAVVSQDMRYVSSEGRTLVAGAVSDNYFSALRPRLLIGRALGPGDAGAPVAVLGQPALTRFFGGEREVLGRTIEVDGRALTIVGVAREEFGGLDDFPLDLWMPSDPAADRPASVVARLRVGVTPAQAAAQLTAFAIRMAPPTVRPADVRALVLQNATVNALSVELLAMLSPVFAAFALVLIAACVNVSNVMLARGVARHREIAVRLSLGASRARVVRQLLTEGLLIAALAGTAAVLLTAWLLRAGTVLLFTTLPPLVASLLRLAPLPVDYRVFLFAFAAAVAAALLFALVPALQASRQPLTAALHGQRTGQAGASRLRSALVVAQVAVSVVLVIAALVLARNFSSLAALDLGYTTGHVFSVNVRGDHGRLIAPMADALSADPRIETVAATGGNPLFVTHAVAAGPEGRGASRATQYTFVSPEFFPLLQIPISRGRAFRADEARDAARVAIVSESTAQAFWPGADPIGQTIVMDRSTSSRVDDIARYTRVTVVGTVRDVVSGLMFEGRDGGHVYFPAAASNPHVVALLIAPRTPRDFRPERVRDTFRRLGNDPDLLEVVALEEMRQTEMYPLRAAAWIGALLGGIALILSISGLYGVLSYTLAQRTREIGIRMALGATAAAVVRLIMRQSARLAAIGAAIGLAVMFSVLKALASIVELRQLSFVDAPAFAAALLLVGLATALAAYFPSRRATRIDPAETLRADA